MVSKNQEYFAGAQNGRLDLPKPGEGCQKYEFRYNGSKSARVVDDEKMRVTRTVWAPAQVVVSTSPKKESASSGVRGRRQHERTEQPLRRRGGAIEGRKGWV